MELLPDAYRRTIRSRDGYARGTLLAEGGIMRAHGATTELSDNQVQELRDRLERCRAEIEARLAARTHSQKPAKIRMLLGGIDTGRMRLTHAPKELVALRQKQIRAALWRIRSGQYGSCLTCGRGIDYQRLRVCPEATHCSHCQGWDG